MTTIHHPHWQIQRVVQGHAECAITSRVITSPGAFASQQSIGSENWLRTKMHPYHRIGQLLVDHAVQVHRHSPGQAALSLLADNPTNLVLVDTQDQNLLVWQICSLSAQRHSQHIQHAAVERKDPETAAAIQHNIEEISALHEETVRLFQEPDPVTDDGARSALKSSRLQHAWGGQSSRKAK